MFQGPKEWRLRNWEKTPVPASEIDAVILTHAHLDHCGLIPRLAKEGFKDRFTLRRPLLIYARSSCRIPDTCKKKRRASTTRNARPSMIRRCHFTLSRRPKTALGCSSRWPSVKPNSSAMSFLSASSTRDTFLAHAWWSCSSVKMEARASFSLPETLAACRCNQPAPGRRRSSRPDPNEDPELLVMESTYGNRVHPHEDVRPQLAQIINDAVHRGGSIVVPAFAVERTQKFLFLIKELMATNQIPSIPVFTDSPMASKRWISS